MEAKIRGCKDMFYILDESQDGMVEMEMMAREIRAGRSPPRPHPAPAARSRHRPPTSAGGLTEEHEALVIERFSRDGKIFVDFMDYLTYIPLFCEIHSTINENPFDTTRER